MYFGCIDMGSGDHARYLAMFNLLPDASLETLDQKYHSYSLELQKQQKSDAALVSTRQAEFDDAYYHLIQEYIRKECENGEYQPREVFSHHDVQVRRHEAVAGRQALEVYHRDWLQAETLDELPESGDEQFVQEDKPSQFTIVMHHGDIFDAPANSVIIRPFSVLHSRALTKSFQMQSIVSVCGVRGLRHSLGEEYATFL